MRSLKAKKGGKISPTRTVEFKKAWQNFTSGAKLAAATLTADSLVAAGYAEYIEKQPADILVTFLAQYAHRQKGEQTSLSLSFAKRLASSGIVEIVENA